MRNHNFPHAFLLIAILSVVLEIRIEYANILTDELFAPLVVMSPHPNDLDGPDLFQNLVDESVLNSDATGISPRKISDQLFKRWRGLKRVFGQDFK